MSKASVSPNQPKSVTHNSTTVPDVSATLHLADRENLTANTIGFSSAAMYPDALTLRVSGDSWQGSPQFTVSVDRQDLGFAPVGVTASHADGQSQEFTFSGTDHGNGPHKVHVIFLNDA